MLSNQIGYSLVNRSAERDLLRSQSPTVVSLSPTDRSSWLLSGKYNIATRPTDRIRTTHPLFLPQNLERVQNLMVAA